MYIMSNTLIILNNLCVLAALSARVRIISKLEQWPDFLNYEYNQLVKILGVGWAGTTGIDLRDTHRQCEQFCQ